jgi:hypothetical protein
MYTEISINEEVAWGTILADAARHISRALSKGSEESESVLLAKIQSRLNAELDAPSSPAEGEFVQS